MRSARWSAGSPWRAPVAMQDHLFWFGSRGCIFTSPSFLAGNTTRPAAVLLLSATGEPIEVSAHGRVTRGDAVYVPPMCTRQLRAGNGGLVSVNIHAQHPAFRAFCGGADAGVLQLDRSAFARHDEQLLDACHGRLSHADAAALFEALVGTATEQLPASEPCDPRVAILRDLMRRSPGCTLEEMAERLHVGYTTASHVFARLMGVPLRSYQLWIKAIRAAARMAVGAQLTHIAHEVGFVDSAHLSRTWRRTYGFAPSRITDGTQVRVLASCLGHGAASRSSPVALTCPACASRSAPSAGGRFRSRPG
ncbi:MAG: helix-turn-helix transcriptional regulator [Deltaproteobacteria bacterium]|nr:MAG: helix-turn-helix transcriptional regulator [Deltaproteobacteria bacterium]